jgi:hypothetical protein
MRYQIEPYNPQNNSAPQFPGISLRSFMENTTTYEDMPVPFTPLLRQGAWVGIGVIAICTLLLLLISATGYGASRSLLILGGQLYSYMNWVIGSAWPFWINTLLLASSVALLVVTRGLKQGKQLYHRLAFALFLCGIANIAMFLFPIVVVGINLILLLILIALVLGIIAAIIMML